MFDPGSLQVYVVASIVLIFTPGPALLYIIATSIHGGRRVGVLSVLGLALGTLSHVLLVALGLSALLAGSTLAYTAVKWAGAAYLLYLGLHTLLSPPADGTTKKKAPRHRTRRELSPERAAFQQGVMVSVLNPKTALFFMAFLPQFVHAEAGHVGLQMFALGILFLMLGITFEVPFALASSTFGRWLRRSKRFWQGQKYISGAVYLALAAMTLFSGDPAPATTPPSIPDGTSIKM